MVNVTVVFTNGNIVEFAAQEFDAELVNTEYRRDSDQGVSIAASLACIPGPQSNEDCF